MRETEPHTQKHAHKFFERKSLSFGFLIAVIVGGIGLYSDVKGLGVTNTQVILAIGIIFVGVVFYNIYLLHEVLESIDKSQDSLKSKVIEQQPKTEALQTELRAFSPALVKATAELRQNAEFVSEGFIGLQRKSIQVEKIPVQQAGVRYSLHGHLPSHIRSSELNHEIAKYLYKGWTPARLIPDYADLINERWKAHSAFIDDGGQCWEFYSLKGLEKYAGLGATAFDEVKDPVEERISRFERLKELNRLPNYNLKIFKNSLNNNILLRTPEVEATNKNGYSGALLLDLRLPDSSTNFEESYYGIYSQSPMVYAAYRKKVEALLNPSDQLISEQNEIEALINSMLANIK